MAFIAKSTDHQGMWSKLNTRLQPHLSANGWLHSVWQPPMTASKSQQAAEFEGLVAHSDHLACSCLTKRQPFRAIIQTHSALHAGKGAQCMQYSLDRATGLWQDSVSHHHTEGCSAGHRRCCQLGRYCCWHGCCSTLCWTGLCIQSGKLYQPLVVPTDCNM